jgi:hypothetical protein
MKKGKLQKIYFLGQMSSNSSELSQMSQPKIPVDQMSNSESIYFKILFELEMKKMMFGHVELL